MAPTASSNPSAEKEKLAALGVKQGPSSPLPAASAVARRRRPRMYRCSLCPREFMSQQALGGHQNAHRQLREQLENPRLPWHPVRFIWYRTVTFTSTSFVRVPSYGAAQSSAGALPLFPTGVPEVNQGEAANNIDLTLKL